MYGINNKTNGVVRMYVTTSATHKLEVRINHFQTFDFFFSKVKKNGETWDYDFKNISRFYF